MSVPQYLITPYLESSINDDIETFREKLFELGVLTKDYTDDGLVLLYHKYETPVTSELQRECRSLVIDKQTHKIVSYSCETPLINKKGLEFIEKLYDKDWDKKALPLINMIITQCYEGTYLSVFYHNNKWYVSTRRCLDSSDSKLNQESESKNHYEMFLDILRKAGYETFDDFCMVLDKHKSYYFVLIHHQNKHIIDYTVEFGDNYTNLCLTSVRDENMNDIDIYLPENKIEFADYSNKGYIFIPKSYNNINIDDNGKYDSVPENEGLIVKVWNQSMNKYSLVKIQSLNYQYALILGLDKNIYRALLHFYQNDKLVNYLTSNMENVIKKIANPKNKKNSYDIIGVIDSVFKVCANELYGLFRELWNLKTGNHRNKELYEILPREYKDILFAIRGIYFQNKANIYQQTNKQNEQGNKTDNIYIRKSDIYRYLKTMITYNFINFLDVRKQMYETANKELSSNQNTQSSLYKLFGSMLAKSDDKQVKLCDIFCHYLFTNELPN
jgi:hypothetical protein